MSKIIYIRVGTKRDKYLENELVDKLYTGEIPSSANFWKEGMTSWGSITQLKEIYPPREVQESRQVIILQHDIAPLTSATTLALLAYAGAITLQIMLQIINFGLVTLGAGTVLSTIFSIFYGLSVAIATIVFLFTAVLFLKWTYRVSVNIKALAPDTEINPTLAVLMYFVPIINFYYPFRALVRVYNSSKQTNKDSTPLVLLVCWLSGLFGVLGALVASFLTGYAGAILQLVVLCSILVTIFSLTRILNNVCSFQYQFVENINVHEAEN